MFDDVTNPMDMTWTKPWDGDDNETWSVHAVTELDRELTTTIFKEFLIVCFNALSFQPLNAKWKFHEKHFSRLFRWREEYVFLFALSSALIFCIYINTHLYALLKKNHWTYPIRETCSASFIIDKSESKLQENSGIIHTVLEENWESTVQSEVSEHQ